jgi:hypothetical protein
MPNGRHWSLPWYHAGMMTVFQFSLGKLLASVSLLCVAMGIFSAAMLADDVRGPILFVLSMIVLSAAFGTLIRRFVVFVLAPVAALAVFVLLVVWSIYLWEVLR